MGPKFFSAREISGFYVPVHLTQFSVLGKAGAVECLWEGAEPFLPDGSKVVLVDNPGSGEKAFWYQDRRIECVR